jgi:hypothetical protein
LVLRSPTVTRKLSGVFIAFSCAAIGGKNNATDTEYIPVLY